MSGVTKKDKIRKEHVRGSVEVSPVTKRITEKSLKWYGHVKSRDEGHVLRRMLDALVSTSKEKGRRACTKKDVRCTSTRKETERKTETRRKDSCKSDMESAGLKEKDALDRTKWKNDIKNHSGCKNKREQSQHFFTVSYLF